ncbi:hypothetical protein [Actinoplanes sp. HUAS TT8]|uniref:hypothetical protein n=1 Tax=Actinoplanes sp. HUAS TT8 TaxID=3447453 RepID=UPI003F520A95
MTFSGLKEMCVRAARQRQGDGTAQLLEALAEPMPGVRHQYLLTAPDGNAATVYTSNSVRPAGRLAVFVRP